MITEQVNTNEIFNKSNLKWLKDNTIYLTVHGSHAYGLSRPDSDIDLRGIAIPPKEYFLGVLDNFEQAQFSNPYDCTIFDLAKFIKLALDCNPNVIELLYTEPEFHIIREPIFEKIFDIRDEFLSKKARYTFAGYARSQLLRIVRHRKWIMYPFTKQPERTDYGLSDNKKLLPAHKLQEIEAQIEKKINEWEFDVTGLDNALAIDIKNKIYDILVDLKINQEEYHEYAARAIGLDDNLLEAFKKERAYKSAMKEWKAFKRWETERNRERYEMELTYGFDCKHASHLVRLYKQCIELLRTHKLVVKRPDREELVAIRNGTWTYDELIEWAGNQDKVLDELYKSSTLKHQPNRKLINNCLIDILEEYI